MNNKKKNAVNEYITANLIQLKVVFKKDKSSFLLLYLLFYNELIVNKQLRPFLNLSTNYFLTALFVIVFLAAAFLGAAFFAVDFLSKAFGSCDRIIFFTSSNCN